jgi:D-alanyl-lipoteichoic acid acyltransferase DltB (MBOAT superfamily)
MKVCIADNLAKISDGVFSQASLSNGAEALIGTYAFSFQIYCDFCGYSNIAQGLGKWLGFDFATNFRTPLFATNPQEFWRRWHISLSLWFRDYLFNPLCLIWRKNSQVKIYISIFVTMTLIGLWHGAAWHYIAMGCYWGILIIVQEILRKSKLIKSMTRAYSNNFIHILKKAAGIILFFQLANLGFLLFRAETMNQVYSILTAILTRFQLSSYVINMCLEMLWLIAPVLFIGVLEYKNNDVNFILKWPYWPRLCVYAILSGLAILDIWSIGFQMGKNFIYLQF